MKKSIVGIVVLSFLLVPLLSTTAAIDPIPEITIVDLKGGIGLTVLIKNVGAANATRVGYHLVHGNGFFLRTTKWIKTLPDIPAGETITLRTGFMRFGIGLGIVTKIPWITLTIYAQDAENVTKTVSARTLGAFIILQ